MFFSDTLNNLRIKKKIMLVPGVILGGSVAAGVVYAETQLKIITPGIKTVIKGTGSGITTAVNWVKNTTGSINWGWANSIGTSFKSAISSISPSLKTAWTASIQSISSVFVSVKEGFNSIKNSGWGGLGNFFSLSNITSTFESASSSIKGLNIPEHVKNGFKSISEWYNPVKTFVSGLWQQLLNILGIKDGNLWNKIVGWGYISKEWTVNQLKIAKEYLNMGWKWLTADNIGIHIVGNIVKPIDFIKKWLESGALKKLFEQAKNFLKDKVWDLGIKQWGGKIWDFISKQLWTSITSFFNNNFASAEKIKTFLLKFQSIPEYLKSFWTGVKYLYQNKSLFATAWKEMTWEKLVALSKWMWNPTSFSSGKTDSGDASAYDFWNSLQHLKEVAEKNKSAKNTEDPMGKEFMNEIVKSFIKNPQKTAKAFKYYADIKKIPASVGYTEKNYLTLEDLKKSFSEDDPEKYLLHTMSEKWSKKNTRYGRFSRQQSVGGG